MQRYEVFPFPPNVFKKKMKKNVSFSLFLTNDRFLEAFLGVNGRFSRFSGAGERSFRWNSLLYHARAKRLPEGDFRGQPARAFQGKAVCKRPDVDDFALFRSAILIFKADFFNFLTQAEAVRPQRLRHCASLEFIAYARR